MRLLILPLMIIVLVLAGCATQTLQQEQAQETAAEEPNQVETKIVKPCPESCDDNNPDTLDACSEQTGYECVHTAKDATELAEDIMRDVNALLKKKHLYVQEKDEGSKVTHYISYGERDEHEQIMVDVLDYDLDSESDMELYLQSEFDGTFMDVVDAERDAYYEYIAEDDYYLEGRGFYDYVNHSVEENERYSEVSLMEGLGYHESVFGSIDLITVNLYDRRDDRDYNEKRFFYHIPFNYRISILCKPNVVVHLYPQVEEYKIAGTNDFVRTQEESYILNHYREIKDDMIKKANKVVTVCE